MMKHLWKDGIALLLSLSIVGGIAFKTLLPDAFASRPAVTLSLEEASARLERIVANRGSSIARIDSRALDPAVYQALANAVTDYGASNDLSYAAKLVEKYNDDGNLDNLREALDIVNDVKQQGVYE
ncbi:hypothetical protein SAMN05216312_103164 [Cohnella sp. OV330]|uniref:hypothetical protein n=1 Tax=Cohnella sp. OV330 TaxID=1855288 RepID=UPI0008E57B84|nr:hypothetical protein [Cohnella sp. OV330]SFB04387.1 hypothetical protein SAMN05216312_103164 [Cohnella sp. OV330]